MGNLEQAAEKKPLIVLTGPTAVGKTALSIQLARRIGGEIIARIRAGVPPHGYRYRQRYAWRRWDGVRTI